MIDLWLLALGFGVLPFLASLLDAIPGIVRRNEAVAWGLLVGVVAFLGLAHAGMALIEGDTFLRIEANAWVAAVVATAGLAVGLTLGWRLLRNAATTGPPVGNAILWAAASFVAVHSFTDGLVLGEAYAFPGSTGFTLTLAGVGGTALHRFAEGALIVVPALLAAWRPPKTLTLLLVGLITLPAAFVPVVILGTGEASLAMAALEQAVTLFGSGLEAGLAILFLGLGLFPRAGATKDARWAAWAGVGFTLLLLVHFLVE